MRTRKRFYTIVVVLAALAIAVLAICVRVEEHYFPVKFRHLVKKYAVENSLDPLLVAAIISKESRFDPKAVSGSSAKGIMQIMPATGEEIAQKLKISPYSEDDLFNPETNIRFGCYYLAKMQKEFDYDNTLALAAYNSGRENVKKWLKDEGNISKNLASKYPFTETRNYVRHIQKIYWVLRLCNRIISI
jgi:soluble lytic murein transglycosylase